MIKVTSEYHNLNELGEPDQIAWNNFVKEFTPPHFEQSTFWAKARQSVGWIPSVLIFRKETEIVGGAQVLARRSRFLGQIGYVSHGPLLKNLPEADPLWLAHQIREAGHKGKFTYLALDLPYDGDAMIPPLRQVGFRPHLQQLPPSGLPEATLVLDLRGDIDSILAQMRASTRYEIRKGAKKGVRVRRGNRADLPLFWDMLVELCTRRNCTPNVPGIAFLNSLWDQFSSVGGIELLVASGDDQPIYCMVLLRLGGWSWAWRVGATAKCSSYHGAQVTYWEAIKLAKEKGLQVFDFLGIYAGQNGTIIGKQAVDGNPYQGITFFKLGFGGTAKKLPGAFGYFPNALVRWVLLTGGERLIKSKGFARLLGRLNQAQS
jgi:lipid II:glycine glycyltransferase (peptidoglycan interpeptide bridge formation enzyme)